jgi:hypothetical protein
VPFAGRIEVDGRGDSLLRFAIRTARSLAISELRKLRPELSNPERLLDDDPVIPRAEPADPLLEKLIIRCREELPKKPAQALEARLASHGNESDDTIAKRLGMRPNTFLQNFTRARRPVPPKVPRTTRRRHRGRDDMTERERQVLIEAATSAWRPRDPDGALRAHPARHDLNQNDRVEVALETRVEAALDPEGLSSTGQAVLSRIRVPPWAS